MTDQELLRLAAKAAGHPDAKYVENFCNPCWFGPKSGVFIGRDCGEHYIWNPLEDDGDALRLAVRVGFSVGYAYAGRKHQDWSYAYAGSKQVSALEVSDPCAATRRAIVRAAAAIGERME